MRHRFASFVDVLQCTAQLSKFAHHRPAPSRKSVRAWVLLFNVDAWTLGPRTNHYGGRNQQQRSILFADPHNRYERPDSPGVQVYLTGCFIFFIHAYPEGVFFQRPHVNYQYVEIWSQVNQLNAGQKMSKSKKDVKQLNETGKRKVGDRRKVSAEASAKPIKERRKVQRRRQIDPTTCEREYSEQEIEFMRAMDEYKRASGRMFPTCSEILEVLSKLGYRQIADATEIYNPNSADQEDSDSQELELAEESCA